MQYMLTCTASRTKKKDIYVISTLKRPVPLEHFLYAGKELFRIVDSMGLFEGQGFKDAAEALKRKQDKEREAAGLGPLARQGAAAARGGQSGRGGQKGGQRGRGRGAPAVANAAVRGVGTFGPIRSSFRTTAAQDKQLWVHLVRQSSFRSHSSLTLRADESTVEEGASTGRGILLFEKEMRGARRQHAEHRSVHRSREKRDTYCYREKHNKAEGWVSSI